MPNTNLVRIRSAVFASSCLFAALSSHAQTSEPVDPQMTEVLDVYKLIAGTPIIELTPQDARQQFAAEDAAKVLARATGRAEASEPVAKIYDGWQVPGPASKLAVRVYVPAGDGPFPIVVYYHGGGFVIATIDTYDASARSLADKARAAVVSVEYRKAPEAPFPAAVDDALAHAGAFNGDATRVAVAGESAGGNLATEVCLLARGRGLPMPRHQLLVYPVTDFVKTDYPSDVKYAHAQPLNLPALEYFGRNYLPSTADASSPEASPLYASLQGLPPATIIAAEIDPLQDQGREYAEKLKAAGVSVKYALYPGVTHEFFGMGAVLEKAAEAETFAGTELRKALQ